MKYLILSLFLVCLLSGCSREILRSKGEPYSGYSCQESLMHFYSHCSDEKLTKEDFEAKVKVCEKELATKVCDKEQALLLCCMGRVLRGTYSSGGGVGVVSGGVAISGGQSGTIDGCDCSAYTGEIKKCRMKQGIFE